MSLMSRFFGPPGSNGHALTAPVHEIEPKRLMPTEIETKSASNSLGLLPGSAYGLNYTFFSPDGGKTFFDTAEGGTTMLAFTAYWYVATRWRASKLAEAPLMVVEEDQDTGMDSWIPDHELASILEEPSPDYDMGELLEITSRYLDNTGGCLWVMDKDRGQRIARITPFSYNEFIPQRGDDRIYGSFEIQTVTGPITRLPEQVCFFRDTYGGTGFSAGGQGVSAWGRGRSRLDIAMSWLALSEQSKTSVRNLLANSVWPSLVISPDKDWDPDPKTLREYREDIQKYGKGRQGTPFVALGGASVAQLGARLKDLVPTEILNRVEAVVAAITGVPAIVLQFQVGLENAPWSHMVQARRMAYEDTIAPGWRKIERVVTRQILRPVDEDPTHYLRFDKTNIDSLKRDQLESAQIATLMGDQASLNERRASMGLEPSPDPKADEIPELTKPTFAEIAAGLAGGSNVGKEGATVPKGGINPAGPMDPNKAAPASALQRKFKGPALVQAFRMEAIPTWKIVTSHLLAHDADEIAGIVDALIVDEVKSVQGKARGQARAMAGVNRYLNEDSKSRWTKAIQPMYVKSSTRAGAVIAADMGISFSLIHANLLKFAARNTGDMITKISETTRSLVAGIVEDGLANSKTSAEIATLIRDASGFTQQRAELIARTETTKAFNGAPTEALKEYSSDSGKVYTKTWSGVLDDRERDEHVDLEGETVAIDDVFSNGLDYPSEPNCRCTVIFNEEDAGAT